jgi:hypothetical protein
VTARKPPDVVFVVLEQHGHASVLTGVYTTGEIALEAAGGHAEWVIPCDVLTQAP